MLEVWLETTAVLIEI